MGVVVIDLESNLPLFRPLVYYRSSATYSLRNGKLSYTSCREVLRDALKKLGFSPEDYGLHSLRSGGINITSVVRNSSNAVPERLLNLHGRWQNRRCKGHVCRGEPGKKARSNEAFGSLIYLITILA